MGQADKRESCPGDDRQKNGRNDNRRTGLCSFLSRPSLGKLAFNLDEAQRRLFTQSSIGYFLGHGAASK
jgi:hypothetical protein